MNSEIRQGGEKVKRLEELESGRKENLEEDSEKEEDKARWRVSEGRIE